MPLGLEVDPAKADIVGEVPKHPTGRAAPQVSTFWPGVAWAFEKKIRKLWCAWGGPPPPPLVVRTPPGVHINN